MTFLGIVVPSLLLVLALRRWIVDVPWRIAILFLALTLGFLHGAVFTSMLPVPVDEVARGYPYRGIFGDVVARNPLTNDTVKLFLPWMQVAREELFHFRAPLWNRYAFSGYPLLGNGESAPFSPLFLATLFVPLPKQIVAMAGLKLFIALLFGFLFVKRFGAGDAAACFAACAFAFSVGQTVNLYYSSGTVMSMLPAALFALLYAMDVRSRRGVVLVALVIALLMAGGHPESVLHIAMGAALVLAIEMALARDVRRVLYPVLGAIAGVALSAPAWVPSAMQVPLSARYASLQGVPHADTFPLTALWAMVSPNGFGSPVRHNWNWISNYFSIASSYIGLLPLVIAIAVLFSRRAGVRERAWIGVAIGIYLVAMNWSFIGHAVRALPLLDVTAHDKFRFVVCFLAVSAGALWLDRASERWLPVPIAVVIGGLAVYVWRVRPTVVRPIDLIGVLTVVAFLVLPRRFAWMLVTLELFVLNAGFNALVDARYYRPRLPIIDALRAHAPAEPFRIVAHDWVFLPNAAAQYGLEDIRGSDPMAFRWYVQALKPITLLSPEFDVLRVGDVDHELIDDLNVRFLLAEPGATFGPKWELVYGGPDGTLFENRRARGRFFMEGGRISTRGRFTLDVNAGAAGLVQSSEPADGWIVTIDGKSTPVECVRGGFIGFHVSAGKHHVRVTYRPYSFYGSLIVTLIAAVALIFPKSWNRTPVHAVVTGP
ncbi:MAG TPA: YfhO family protein [Thermoanaerobaculia bacterium]